MTTTTGAAAPAVFNFQSLDVRVFADDSGEPWFCAADVCVVLGYRNDSDAIAKHCRVSGVAKRDLSSGGQMREMTFINEGNLYRLIIKSRKPEAQAFEQEVMEVILPAIRKTGQYRAPAAPLPEPPVVYLGDRTQVTARVVFTRMLEERDLLGGPSAARFQDELYRKFSVVSHLDIPASEFPRVCELILSYPLPTPPLRTTRQLIAEHKVAASRAPVVTFEPPAPATMPGAAKPPVVSPKRPVAVASPAAPGRPRRPGGAGTCWLTHFDIHGVGHTEQVPADSFVFSLADLPDMLREPGGVIPRRVLPQLLAAIADRLRG